MLRLIDDVAHQRAAFIPKVNYVIKADFKLFLKNVTKYCAKNVLEATSQWMCSCYENIIEYQCYCLRHFHSL